MTLPRTITSTNMKLTTRGEIPGGVNNHNMSGQTDNHRRSAAGFLPFEFEFLYKNKYKQGEKTPDEGDLVCNFPPAKYEGG
jgi:hypothetical protein